MPAGYDKEDVGTLLTTTAEMVKDVQRLLSEGDTTGAQNKLGEVAANLTSASENVANNN